MAVFAPVFMFAQPARTQVQRQSSSAGQANTQLMQQYQQASAARDALQAENSQLKQRAEQLQQQIDAATRAQATAERKASGLQQQSKRESEAQKTTAVASEKLQAQLTEVIGRYRELAQQLKEVEAERAGLRSKGADDLRKLGTCTDHNAQMYLLSEEILGKYEHQGFWNSAADKEPFTRLSRMRLENLADDYRERIGELRVEQAATPPTGAAKASAGHAAPKP